MRSVSTWMSCLRSFTDLIISRDHMAQSESNWSKICSRAYLKCPCLASSNIFSTAMSRGKANLASLMLIITRIRHRWPIRRQEPKQINGWSRILQTSKMNNLTSKKFLDMMPWQEKSLQGWESESQCDTTSLVSSEVARTKLVSRKYTKILSRITCKTNSNLSLCAYSQYKESIKWLNLSSE